MAYLAQFITERAQPATPAEFADEFGQNAVDRVWEILVPAERYDDAAGALRDASVMHATIAWTAPSSHARVWGFTFDAALEAAGTLHLAGVPMAETRTAITTVTTATRHFTASAVVLDLARSRVLLIHHNASGHRQFPGGHIDPDETGDQAALREVFEETSVHAQIWGAPPADGIPGAVTHPTPFMTCEFPAPAKPHKGEPEHHHIDLLYIATADSEAPLVHQQAEVAEAFWIDIDDLVSATVRADVPVVVDLVLKHVLPTTPG